MNYLIRWTVPNSPNVNYLEIGQEKDLAETLDKMAKIGDGRTIKLYSVIPLNYKIKYKDKQKITIEKIPEIEFLS